MLYKKVALLFILMTFVLSSCNSPVYNQTEGNVADVKIRTQQALKKSDTSGKPIPALIVEKGMYVDKTPISLAKQPTWLKNKIILRGDQLPFAYYSRTIVGGAGKNVLTHYQTGLDEAVKVTFNYSGTVRGALDLLAAKTGYVYSVNGDSVYWQSYITKTFDVAFMPGSSDYMMGKAAGSGSISNVASGGATGAVAVSAIVDDSAASQFSNLRGTLSVWKDLESTVKQLLSKDGSVIVSESTTSVTVRDRPSNVELVGKYISNLNNNLTKQVLVKVQILDVVLENDFNWGINWDLVKDTLDGTQFFLSMDMSTPLTISSFSPGNPRTFGVQGSGATHATAIINALNQQGHASIVTEPRVVCLNNQVSAIRIINQQGYLASVQTTSLAGSSSATGASVTSQLTPGNIVTGLTLYILPKILGDKVYLQVNADISNNPSFQTISSATGPSATSDVTATSGASIIQVPNVSQKQFNQRSVIHSGDTLILSGFRQLSNSANAMQLLTSQTLGGKAAQQVTNETIILITPIILHGPL
jgi:type IVB pilus formation R64 PilN family outer membrane protein